MGVRCSGVECHFHFTNSVIKFYLTMIIVTIIGIFIAIPCILNYMTFCTKLFDSANGHLPRCFRSWTFLLNIGLNMIHSGSFVSVLFRFSTNIFYREVPGFATNCPCGVWCRGLTTCLLYVGPLLAATKQLYGWFGPPFCLSVCHTFFTMFHAKGQGQRSGSQRSTPN